MSPGGQSHQRPAVQRRAASSGQAVIECVGSLILFTLMMTIMVSITAFLYFQQALVTAAREGARQASLHPAFNSPATEGQGINQVRTLVARQIQQLTGQVYDPDSATITVVPPSESDDQTPGQRTVSVIIRWQLANPVGVSGFMNALGANGETFRSIPVGAIAVMRYEE